MLDILQAIILSIVQGIAEWLPISSSGHLAILQYFFNFSDLSFDVFLHFASILAVIFVFRKDILDLLNFKEKQNIKYLLLIVIAMIPAALVGYFLRGMISSVFSKILFVGIFFIINGILIFSTRFIKERKKSRKTNKKEKRKNPSLFNSLIIGFVQVFSLLPGISRSGLTISAGLFTGLKKEDAIKFSFLLAIPVVLGATVFEAKNISLIDINPEVLIISFIITFLASLLSIFLVKKTIKTNKFYLFGIYTFILGLVVLIFSLI